MDIEDIIKAIAPFAFIIFWVVSSVLGSMKQGQPAKTARPVFKPPWAEANEQRPSASQPRPVARPASVWESLVVDDDEDEETYDEWRQVPPPKRTVERPIQRNIAAELTAMERVRQLIEEKVAAARNAAGQSTTQAAINRAEEESPDRQSVNYNQSVVANLSHLVSDHAADVHLGQMGAAPASVKATPQPYAELIGRLKKPDAARDALVMSIILGEPKCRQQKIRH